MNTHDLHVPVVRRAGLAAALLALAAAASAFADGPELFFSEYVDGATTANRALELYNLTGQTIDLAAGNYRIRVYANGSATPTSTFALVGTIAPGDTFVLADANAPNAIIQAAGDQFIAGLAYSGDDAIELVRDPANTQLDVIGQIGFDPGAEWGSGDTSTQDNTIRRRIAVCGGDADGSDAFDPSIEWDGFANGTFDGLGTHANLCVMVNELDTDTPGTDSAEFIELFDTGIGGKSLDGLVVVLFDGATDQSYAAFDLDGKSTDANGYFVLGNSAVTSGMPASKSLTFANSTLQQGADAVAVFVGDATDFPNGTAVATMDLVDALVYETNDGDDAELLALLKPGEGQVNESGGSGLSTALSCQRCTNGDGGFRTTSAFVLAAPTARAANAYLVAATATASPPITTGCPGSTSTLTASVGADETAAWYTGSCGGTFLGEGTTLVVSPSTTTTYRVAAIDLSSGCESGACGTVKVTVTGPPTWYLDQDGDGLGDPATPSTTCIQPVGYVDNAGDGCPTDGTKSEPGLCGCGVAETDSDLDSIPDCFDGCPSDPFKSDPGFCGCGVDASSAWTALGKGTEGPVFALLSTDDRSAPGQTLYVGGAFDSAGGEPGTKGIARWDGKAWLPVVGGGLPELDSEVRALAHYHDATLGQVTVAAGRFSGIGGVEAVNVAAWNGLTWTGFDLWPSGPVDGVRALARSDGPAQRLYAGGRFSVDGGTDQVAEWYDGNWTPILSKSSTVNALAFFDDGSGAGPAVYAGLEGSLEDGLAGAPFGGSAIIRWDGKEWSAVGSGLVGQCLALVVFDDGSGEGPALYAGGSFLSLDEELQSSVVKWDGSSWTVPGIGLDVLVTSLIPFDDGIGTTLFAGAIGGLAGADAAGAPGLVAKLVDGAWLPILNGVDGPVGCLGVHDDDFSSTPALFVGGSIFAAGGERVQSIARYGKPETCGCLADLDESGTVDGADLGLLLGAWGSSDVLADLDGSGTVDGGDLGLMLGAWGPC